VVVGEKGVPTALIETIKGGEHIDLFPMSWLPERGCTVMWEEDAHIITPKGRRVQFKFWGGQP
jgi:hypothetical protein